MQRVEWVGVLRGKSYLVVVRDSRKLRNARLAKEKAKAEEAKSEQVLEALKPIRKSEPAPEPPTNTGKIFINPIQDNIGYALSLHHYAYVSPCQQPKCKYSRSRRWDAL